jgi:hypothetical protein
VLSITLQAGSAPSLGAGRCHAGDKGAWPQGLERRVEGLERRVEGLERRLEGLGFGRHESIGLRGQNLGRFQCSSGLGFRVCGFRFRVILGLI